MKGRQAKLDQSQADVLRNESLSSVLHSFVHFISLFVIGILGIVTVDGAIVAAGINTSLSDF